VRLAELLIKRSLFNQARVEVNSALKAKEEEGARIPERLQQYTSTEWYNRANADDNNIGFYYENKGIAEEFIFRDYPWLKACLGDTYTVPAKPDKPRRKLYVETEKGIIEVVLSDRKFAATKRAAAGETVSVKGEWDSEKQFQVYLMEKRKSEETFDIFEKKGGNILHTISEESGTVTGVKVAVIDKDLLEGVFYFSRPPKRVSFVEGAPVWVKTYRRTEPSKGLGMQQQTRTQILAFWQRGEGSLWDCYLPYVGVVDHINREKGVVHCFVDQNIDAVIKRQLLPNTVTVGAKLELRLRKVEKQVEGRFRPEVYYTVISCTITDKEPTYRILKDFAGIIMESGNVGFVDDVFIDAQMMENFGKNVYKVKGTAIQSYNKKKGTWGWKAILLQEDRPIKAKE
jgi:hypothetical protein